MAYASSLNVLVFVWAVTFKICQCPVDVSASCSSPAPADLRMTSGLLAFPNHGRFCLLVFWAKWSSSFPFPKPWHIYNTSCCYLFIIIFFLLYCSLWWRVKCFLWKCMESFFFFLKDWHMYDYFTIMTLICFWSYVHLLWNPFYRTCFILFYFFNSGIPYIMGMSPQRCQYPKTCSMRMLYSAITIGAQIDPTDRLVQATFSSKM